MNIEEMKQAFLERSGLTEEEIMSNPEYFIHRWYYGKPERMVLLEDDPILRQKMIRELVDGKLREKNG